MSVLAETTTSKQALIPSIPRTVDSERLVDVVRREFLEMPGLSLTLPQAAKVFGVDIRQSKRLLKALLDEGFLVCDARGAFRRRDVSFEVASSGPRRTRASEKDVHDKQIDDHSSPSSTKASGDVLETMGVELPCLGCDRSYVVSLRNIRLSQSMMDAGCQVRHFADCPPAALAHLIDPVVLAEFEEAVEQIELAAEGAGGRLVGPR